MSPSVCLSLLDWFKSLEPQVQTGLITVAGVFFTVLVTSLIAVWQLRVQTREKRLDREIETKREVLIDGVRALNTVSGSLGSLHDLGVPLKEITDKFQAGMQAITAAGSVAKIDTVTAGRLYVEAVGPAFHRSMQKRVIIERERDPATVAKLHRELVVSNLTEVVKLNPIMLRAVAAIRDDIGIAKESHDEFMKAAQIDLKPIHEIIESLKGA